MLTYLLNFSHLVCLQYIVSVHDHGDKVATFSEKSWKKLFFFKVRESQGLTQSH